MSIWPWESRGVRRYSSFSSWGGMSTLLVLLGLRATRKALAFSCGDTRIRYFARS
jgi:hypothetical protein